MTASIQMAKPKRTKKPNRYELILRDDTNGAYQAEVTYARLSAAKKDLAELYRMLSDKEDPCRCWHGSDVSKVTSAWIADVRTGEIVAE